MRPVRSIPSVRTAAGAATIALALAVSACSTGQHSATAHAASPRPGGSSAQAGGSPAAAPAGSAATGGWRGVAVVGAAAHAWTSQLVATGAGDAWSFWTSCTVCTVGQPATTFRVEHWDGTSWAQASVPQALAATAGSAVALGASSASNAWLVAPGAVLRWNGASWQRQPVPGWVTLGSAGLYKVSAAVFGPDSAWVFSLDRNAEKNYYAARYNGRDWARVALPGSPEQVSALAPDDIWVLGATRATAASGNPATILMHWNGTSWTSVAAPGDAVPASTTVDNGELVATGPRDAWLVRQEQRVGSDGQTVVTGAYLLHWDGTSWAKVSIGAPAQTSIEAMAADGQGGLWLAGLGVSSPSPGEFLHYSGGHWTSAAIPGGTLNGTPRVGLGGGITWIPGTRSLWASGTMVTGAATSATPSAGVILKQGP
jgi:hypothetical protein